MTISASQVMELRSLTGAGLMDCKRALQETEGDFELAQDHLRKKGVSIAAKKSDRETTEGSIGLAFSDDAKKAVMVQLACETDFVARNDKFQALVTTLCAQALKGGVDKFSEQKLDQGEGTVAELVTQSIGGLGENLQLLNAVALEAEGNGVMGGYVHSNQKIGVLVSLKAETQADTTALKELARDIAMHVAASSVSAVSPEDVDQALVEKEREIFTAQAKESGKPDEIIAKMVEGRLNKFLKEQALLSQSFVKDPERTVEKVLADAGKTLGATLSVEKFLKIQF